MERDRLTGHNKVRICLVDDEPIVVKTLAGFLTTIGCSVLSCGDANALFGLLEDEPVDLILLDLLLPGLKGETLVREVRRRHPDIPLVIMTGNTSIYPSSSLDHHGIHAFLHKPFHLTELEKLVEELTKERSGQPVASGG